MATIIRSSSCNGWRHTVPWPAWIIYLLIAAIMCYVFRPVSADQLVSSSYPEDHSLASDSFEPHLLNHPWDGAALSSNSSQKNTAKDMSAEVNSRNRQLRAPNPKNQPGRILFLKKILNADAVRLKQYSFSTTNGLFSPKISSHISNKASKGRNIARANDENLTGTVFDRISSGGTLGSGQYLADIYIGTPAKKYTLIVDTGSDLIWVQCSPCQRCFRQSNAMYAPRNSSSFSSVPCTAQHCFFVPAPAHSSCNARSPTSCKYTYMYSDDTSTTGSLASETVTMMSSSGELLEISNVTFGCGLRNEGPSLLGSNGVLGLGQGELSFASQLGSRLGSKFSYCLVNHLKPTTESSLLVFGNAKIKGSLKNAFKYTPLLKNKYAQTYYYVGIKHVSVNRKILPIPSEIWKIDGNGLGGTILDSGTTLTYFRVAAYSSILAAFQKAITIPRVSGFQALDLCYNFSTATVEQIPRFSLILEGNIMFHPPPENYFVDVAPEVKCLAMQGTASTLGSNTIGNLMQQNFLIEYDRLSARLGFVRTNCSSALYEE